MVIIGFVFLLCIYAATRFYNLTLLPIFTDEAIYIRWSQIGANDANWRFISLTDGKQPLFTWVMMALSRVLPATDPLFVGRLVSVMAGAGTMVGLWLLARELFGNRRVAWLASIIYLLSPFAVVYDRMALYDSLVATFFVWNTYLAILLVRTLRLDVALILGMTLGAGMLNKTSGFLSLYLLPVTLLLFDWQRLGKLRRLGRWIVLGLVAAILSQIFYSVLRLSPFFHLIGQKDNVFVFSFSEWMKEPFRYLYGNLRGMFDWLRGYLTLPVFVAAIIPFAARWGKWKERLLLYLYWIIPFVGLANFGKVLYPRFVFFMAMPLLVLAALTVEVLWKTVKQEGNVRLPGSPARSLPRFAREKTFTWQVVRRVSSLIVFVLILLWPLKMDALLLTNPLVAPMPRSDKGQYVDDWPSGWGVREVVAFLKAEAMKGKVVVFTEGTFGLMPYALEIYLVGNPNVEIHGIWPLPEMFPKEIEEAVGRYPTYFITNQRQEAPVGWPLELIGEYQKGNRVNRKLRLYRVGSSVAYEEIPNKFQISKSK